MPTIILVGLALSIEEPFNLTGSFLSYCVFSYQFAQHFPCSLHLLHTKRISVADAAGHVSTRLDFLICLISQNLIDSQVELRVMWSAMHFTGDLFDRALDVIDRSLVDD